MQSVFSIKDAISKKESREISALFGVTVTQVYITPPPVYISLSPLARYSFVFCSLCKDLCNQYACSFVATHLYLVCYLFQAVIRFFCTILFVDRRGKHSV